MTRKILLTGPAGSGKTYSILREFQRTLRESDDPLSEDVFLVLPSAEHTERVMTLVLQDQLKGFFYRRVTTLSRLIQMLFGVGDEGTATHVTRYLFLKEHLAASPQDYFREVQDTPGFLNLLLGFVTELKESLVPAELFRTRMNALKRLEPDLASKYEALAGLFEYYENELKRRGLRDPQDALAVYRERIKNQKNPRPRKIRKLWIDGFFDFSELQAAYIDELCELSEEVTVTLTLDDRPERAELFETALRTQTLLMQRGFEKQVLPARERDGFPQALSVVERHLFESPAPAKRPGIPSQDLQILEAVGVEGEVEMIARKIEQLRRSQDLRFSDFAVLLRNIGEYETVIRSTFPRYGIPFEIHEREKLSFAPAMRPVAALLRIFSEGWKIQDLMTFFKSGYVRTEADSSDSLEWASALENEALRRKILEGREGWLQDWQSGAFEQERLGKLSLLASVEDRLRSSRSFAEQKGILREAAERTFRIFQTPDTSQEHVRRDAASHRRFISLLDEIENSARGEALEIEALAERFFRLLELDLYSLHDHDRNRVQVYNVSLARQKEYEVVFAAGLLEKKFPVQIKEDPLLSDWERKLFNGLGTEACLKERLPSQSLERYLFYMAVTRARRRLFLSYPKLDLEGKSALASFYVAEVRALFQEALPETRQRLSRPFPELDEAVNLREAEMSLMGGFWDPLKSSGQAAPLLLETAAKLLESPVSREKIRKAFFEVRDELTDPEIRKKEPFRPWRTSSSALEDYAKCSFKYYAGRVLRLEDPEEDRNVKARGNILHYVLEHALRSWTGRPEIFLHPERALQEAYQLLEKALREFPLLCFRRYQYELEISELKDTLAFFLNLEIPRMRDSWLKPAFFELAFGLPGSEFPPLAIAVRGGKSVEIGGKIDRIDLDSGRRRGTVLDYKRTAKFSDKTLEAGTLLQLPIYSLVLERVLKIRSEGAELYSLTEGKRSGFYRESAKDLFPEGFFSRKKTLEEDGYAFVLDRAEAFIERFTQQREAMRFEPRPRDLMTCRRFCAYDSVCRVQKWKLETIEGEIKASDAAAMPRFFDENGKSRMPEKKNEAGEDSGSAQ